MVSVIILAAGKGKRMRSKTPKVLHSLLGKPLLAYGLETALSLNPQKVVVVTSPPVSEAMSRWSPGTEVSTVIQDPPQGTADAVRRGLTGLASLDSEVLILPGDVPLIRRETLEALLLHFHETDAVLSILAADLENPFGYGRIIQTAQGEVSRIVEERDATDAERTIRRINSGIMIVRGPLLGKALDRVTRHNAQSEFYLTDLAEIFHRQGLKVTALPCEDPEELSGINDRIQLSEVTDRLLHRIISGWQKDGVTFLRPQTCYVEPDVQIGQDTIVAPGVFLRGRTQIGENCRIGTGAVIEDSEIGPNVEIRPYSVIEGSRVSARAAIGPFAHLRPGSDIGEEARVGNFVEVKQSRLEPGVKASHLTYLGDTTIGAGTNVGAGTITCNYDGRKKHRTTIGEGVFVGSNTALVAPVTVGDRAIIAAGSVITKPVPPGTLAVGRSRQQNLYRKTRHKKES